MNNSAYHIAIPNLLLIFIPILIVLFIYVKWSMGFKTILYATSRMVIQLIVVGYALIAIFDQSSVYISTLVLLIMLLFASWIALRPLKELRRKQYFKALFSICAGGVPILAIVVLGVIKIVPWYMPRYLIPLAGMVFASSMNSVSLCAERFHAERSKGESYIVARKMAYQTSLLPLMNSFFAVGLVSIPGMMTGQILAGLSPLLAVRYQIMVMCMLLGTCGICSAIYLSLQEKGEE
jgi:putative ABC transport system permease protein